VVNTIISHIKTSKHTELLHTGSEDDILEINEIKVVPATIVPGKEFTIEATGKLREVIQDGAFVDVVIKLGLINILRKQYDLCDTIAKKEGNEIRCPIPADDIKVIRLYSLTKEILLVFI
jgi:hypothetical protein